MLIVSRRLLRLSALTVLSGCALRPDAGGAAEVAHTFHEELAGGDASAACDLLAPTTRQELEGSSGQPCRDALAGEDLPAASTVGDVEAYVRSARVVLDGDVVFVAEYGDTWLVTAAGCVRQAGNSYDCSVKGG